MTQTSLFDAEIVRSARVVTPYQPSSETSREAARKAQWFGGQQSEKVYQHILASGTAGATDKDIERVTGISRQSICARRKGLRQQGKIQDSGQRRDGCVAWVVGL